MVNGFGKMKIVYLSIIALLVLTTSCGSLKEKESSTKITIDEDFTAAFYTRGEGFTGGDGVYSVLLPDGRTVWIFGDTFVGAVNEDNSRTKTDPIYIRNSFVIQDGMDFKFLCNDSTGPNRSVMIPPHVVESNFEISEYDQWYWPGDGFVIDDQLKIFASEFHQVDTGMWGFEWKKSAIITFSLPDFKQQKVDEFDYGMKTGVHYGHAVLEDSTYLYIYGLGDGKAHVARVDIHNLDSEWEFGHSKGWTKNPMETEPMIDFDGSEQFSLMKIEDTYYYFTQAGGLSDEVYVFSSDNPYSNWEGGNLIFKTELDTTNKNLFTYNALAHPQFVNDKGILVSYNTNSFKLADHYKDAGIYRPRFVRVPLKFLLKN